MKQVKKYIAISLWAILCLFLIHQYRSNSLVKSEEQKAIFITNQKIKESTQKIHQSKLKKANFDIEERGNNYRDRAFFNKIKNAYFDIENLYETDKINLQSLKSSLTDSASKYITTHPPNPVNNNSKTLKEIYKTNLYQNAYNLLNQEYSMLYGIYCGFNKSVILNSSDTTLGLYSTYNINRYIEIPKTTIQFINQTDNTKSDWKLQFDKNFTEPIIFQVNTHTKTGIIAKRYQIKPKKNQKLQPFDYEEIK
ncbi:hypothetical protein V9L05_12290 [Bernardetia sp. Wsw4-3y2]|uniref:hypothetical protein n=1 Tax=Bernardetia sp. Wsw4-3y2 TaxID=3127471 RepID=UPI0030CD6EFE